ncbi:hypothetical protein [Mycobacterium sp. GA-1841]|uniref:hypothetical protein n=1 Tax=Mycobacterium sp. GA-1841 TaxID=1834154 RepID=UPI001115A49D|nr:hypothetical protein [Mycobacterium sp. GA-1841]
MDIDYNDQTLNDGLEMLPHQNKSGRLSRLTSSEWDEVHLFHEYTSREFIEQAVGSPVTWGRWLPHAVRTCYLI